ncbi:hypothetical protein B0A55_13720 [Friedmanniomyces simplex]|uniref:Uncharacterized protein n=1 Tax=Friedmanniomyces simplex TaxID=329884 RepID=A0A4U0VYQ2_9PEZI|nr:hypothetical protein B0A55_13720 [Friedmanniomyces simplex]
MAMTLRAALRTHLAAWPFNNAAPTPYIELPRASQISLTSDVAVPLPFVGCRRWKTWYTRHNESLTRSSDYFTTGLQDGTALLPIELDEDQEGRKRLRDERTVAAKRRRADAAAKARREEERRLARLEAKKIEALEKNQAAILLSRMRAAEKAEQDRMRKERAQDRERMRLAKRAAEAQASAQLKWKTTQRVGEKTLWEGIVGRTWRNSRTLDLGGSVAGDAEADADSDASADSDGEISERAHRDHCGLLGGFSLMQGYVCTYGNTASASAKKGKVRTTPVVSAATLADPRSELAEDEVNAILRERGLPAKKAEEMHPQAIARLWAADQDLSTTELHDRLRRYFIKIKGTRQEKLQAMAEYEAGEAGA